MRLFLAATNFGPLHCEYRKEFIAKHKPKYLLESFAEGEECCAEVIKDVGVDNFLLDSGAFTFCHSKKNITMKELEEYTTKFIQFIIKYNVKYFFEMDVDSIFGLGEVERLRKRIETETQRKSIPVWHDTRGIEYWKRMCQDYDYVAVGGLVSAGRKATTDIILKRMVDYAKQRGVKVHLLGYTTPNKLNLMRPYSSDGCTYAKITYLGGQYCKFVNGKMVQTVINKNGKKLNIKDVIWNNLAEYIKYQKFMEALK